MYFASGVESVEIDHEEIDLHLVFFYGADLEW